MKISVILTSFNRPKWIRDSLKSLEDQTYRDFEVIVIDESDEFDVKDAVRCLKVPQMLIRHHKVTPEERMKTNRLSVNCNEGLRLASGDLVCFLADDDYYYPDWFAAAVNFFRTHPLAQVGFGKLVYSSDPAMVFPKVDPSQVRFYKDIVKDPFNKLDHNQVIHRRWNKPFEWPAGVHTVCGPDAYYFREIGTQYPFHPIDSFAAVKRIHRKSLLETQAIYINGFMEGLRE